VIPFLVVVGTATLIVLVGLLVALFRRMRALALSMARLQRDLMPLLESIQKDSERVQARLADVTRPSREPGVG
jgi:uncharacterized membrane protein